MKRAVQETRLKTHGEPFHWAHAAWAILEDLPVSLTSKDNRRRLAGCVDSVRVGAAVAHRVV